MVEQRAWQLWKASMQREALQCLVTIAGHMDAKRLLTEQGAVRAALRVVEADCDTGGDTALLAQQLLTSLSVGDGVEATLVGMGVAEALVAVIAEGWRVPVEERACALNTLTNLCASDEATRGQLVSRGVVEALTATLESSGEPPSSHPKSSGEEDVLQTQAALAMMNLSFSCALPAYVSARDSEDSGPAPRLMHRIVQALVKVSGSDRAGQDACSASRSARRRYACISLSNLAVNEDWREALLAAGALRSLAAFLAALLAGRPATLVAAPDDPALAVMGGVTTLCTAGPAGAEARATCCASEPELVAQLRATAESCCIARATLEALIGAESGRSASGPDEGPSKTAASDKSRLTGEQDPGGEAEGK
jgi:hypothetical protein